MENDPQNFQQNPQQIAPQNPPQIIQAESNGLAIASLILGILGFFFGPFSSIPAIICGHLGRAAFRKNPAIGGDGLAVAGLIMGYIITVTVALLLLFFIVMFCLMGAAHSGMTPQFH